MFNYRTLLSGSFFGAALILLALVGWYPRPGLSPIAEQRLHDLYVGQGGGTGCGNNMQCCIRGTLSTCDYACVANITCPAGVQTFPVCSTAQCSPPGNDPNFNCTCTQFSPCRGAYNTKSYNCTTTGNIVPCANPPNTQTCQTNGTTYYVTSTNGCNAGESACTNQPPNACTQ